MKIATRPVGLAVAVLALVAGAAGQVEADLVIAYDNAAVPSDQSYNAGSVGLDFNVNAPITITSLGAFDSGNLANLNLNGGVTVGIFDRTTGQLVGPSVTLTSTSAGITQVNGDAFVSVTPFVLQAGFQGSIVTFLDPLYNSAGSPNTTSTENSGGGLISFVGVGRHDYSGSFDYPNLVDGGPSNRYDAGTFTFSTATPEPSTIVSACTGALIGIGYTWRRRKRSAIA